jgi:hypothetical protein
MIFLRCLSFLIGSLIIIGAPFFLLPDASPRPSEFGAAIAACAAIALLASGFFLVGIAGNHMKRSPRTRILGAALLGLPIIGCIAVLLFGQQRDEIWMIGPVLCFAIFLFATFVYPARRSPTHRRMRPRDPAPAVKA